MIAIQLPDMSQEEILALPFFSFHTENTPETPPVYYHSEIPPRIVPQDFYPGTIIFDLRSLSPTGRGFRPRPVLSMELMYQEVDISLTRPLRIGEGKWSQTWLGSMSFKEIGPFPVVVKLYQQSLFPQFHGEKGKAEWIQRGGRYDAREHAAFEAWSYRKLCDLQGEHYIVCLYRDAHST